MSNATRKVQLSQPLLDRLRQPTKGTGGYQSFVQDIVSRLEGDMLAVDPELQERIEHYAYDFGKGAWQLLLRDLLDEIESSLRQP